MRTMHDSITATDIPANATMVAGYVNGTYQWSAADWARFPHAIKVRIATRSNVNDGHVLDVETGAAIPGQAPGWVEMRRAAGVDPTVYCNASTQIAIQAAFNAAGVPQPHYWVAHYDNIPMVPPGAVAKQYINDPASGGHYDLSAVADYWPGVDSAPNPTPGPTGKPGEDDMAMIRVPKGGAAGGIAKAVNFPLALSMLFDHDVIIAPGDMPVVLYAAYNWTWSGNDDKASPGTGGNPIVDPNQPKVIYSRGSYSFIVPAKTGKCDLIYWSDDDFTVTVERRV